MATGKGESATHGGSYRKSFSLGGCIYKKIVVYPIKGLDGAFVMDITAVNFRPPKP